MNKLYYPASLIKVNLNSKIFFYSNIIKLTTYNNLYAYENNQGDSLNNDINMSLLNVDKTIVPEFVNTSIYPINLLTTIENDLEKEVFDNANLPACFASDYTAQLNEKGKHL